MQGVFLKKGDPLFCLEADNGPGWHGHILIFQQLAHFFNALLGVLAVR